MKLILHKEMLAWLSVLLTLWPALGEVIDHRSSGLLSDVQDLKCEPIKVEMCAHLGYNTTGLPNFLGHRLQSDAKAALKTFSNLVQYQCSPDLLFFLCSVHVPMCAVLPTTTLTKHPQYQLIGPCRSLCERVRDACLSILSEFQHVWPESLWCDRFPAANTHHTMCMDNRANGAAGNGGGSSGGFGGGGFDAGWLGPPSYGKGGGGLKAAGFPVDRLKAAGLPVDGGGEGESNAYGSRLLHQLLQNYPELLNSMGGGQDSFNPQLLDPNAMKKLLLDTNLIQKTIKPAQGFAGTCSQLANSVLYHHINRTGLCVAKCGKDILYDKDDKHFADTWLLVWSVLCFLTTAFTILTFLVDSSRFLYPEKCIIFINLSYNILSIGYLIRLAVGFEGVACTGALGQPTLLLSQGLPPTPACTIVFLLVYFSSLSAAVWWSVTTTTWVLNVLLNISSKALESRSPIFHMAGWGLPALQTLAVLVLNQIEGDELTGVCLPGQWEEEELLHHLVIPHAILMGTGFLLVLTGVTASLAYPSPENRKLLARIGIFSIFYTIPQICVLASFVYEYSNRPIWKKDSNQHPIIEVMMMRISMWLVVGIISGSWVWSHRTFVVWQSLGSRCCGLWTRGKKPATPQFPHVAYRPAPSDNQEKDVITLENLATLRRGGDNMGPPTALPPPVPLTASVPSSGAGILPLPTAATHFTGTGLPYTVENNKIIL